MDIIELYHRLMDGYKDYIESFVGIKDRRIEAEVKRAIREEILTPEALIQFNPNYKKGVGINEMIESGLPIHQDLSLFFNTSFYLHQQEAITLGCQDKEFIVTSGTGSGKSRTFMATIFNYILQHRDICRDKTIAIIVYPMNALINSQYNELDIYRRVFEEKSNGRECPFTFGKYTGQEDEAEREQMQRTPPNIILTNYMMLELLMTRAGNEEGLRKCFLENLHFLVFDELHTYRGMQGSDVSFLIRRIKAQAKEKVLCFGTSATMVSDETMSYAEQKKKVADVASCIFGSEFSPEQIIDETLSRGLDVRSFTTEDVRAAIQSDIPDNEEGLRRFPTALWIEQNIALNYNETEDKYFRGKPISLNEMGKALHEYVGAFSQKECCEHITAVLNRCNEINIQRQTNLLPFKIHQFIPQTGSVYATLGPSDLRYLTVEEKLYCEELSEGESKVQYYPLVFSRHSGHEFYVVKLDTASKTILARNFDTKLQDDNANEQSDGYISIPQPTESLEEFSLDINSGEIPDDWFGPANRNGERRLKPAYRDRIPKKIFFDIYGNYSESEELFSQDYTAGWYVPAPLRYDPTAKVVYNGHTSEWSKLAKIGGEGRSTATTILSYESVVQMKSADVDEKDRKVLTFVDARQDAALQAGHFNDFIRIGKIRSAIWNTVKNADTIIDNSNIARRVFDCLGLELSDFSIREGLRGRIAKDVESW